mgnify:CR=1 FL=1
MCPLAIAERWILSLKVLRTLRGISRSCGFLFFIKGEGYEILVRRHSIFGGRSRGSLSCSRRKPGLTDHLNYIFPLHLTLIGRRQHGIRVWVRPLGCRGSSSVRSQRALLSRMRTIFVRRDVHVRLIAISYIIDRRELQGSRFAIFSAYKELRGRLSLGHQQRPFRCSRARVAKGEFMLRTRTFVIAIIPTELVSWWRHGVLRCWSRTANADPDRWIGLRRVVQLQRWNSAERDTRRTCAEGFCVSENLSSLSLSRKAVNIAPYFTRSSPSRKVPPKLQLYKDRHSSPVFQWNPTFLGGLQYWRRRLLLLYYSVFKY